MPNRQNECPKKMFDYPNLAMAFSILMLLLPVLASAQQSADPVALAVLPLPEAHRDGATILRLGGDGWTKIRNGDGDFVCLADAPADGFHVACYHKSLEPYMARGRTLKAEGLDTRASIERRWQEIDAGELEMPTHPAALFQLFGERAPGANLDVTGLNRLSVLYVAYQTSEDLGLPETPADGLPWLMFSGKPTAHVMISH